MDPLALLQDTTREYTGVVYDPEVNLSGSPVMGPGREARPAPLPPRYVSSLDQIRADVRGEPVATRSRAPGGEQGRWNTNLLLEEEDELEGIARGPGISKAEAVGHLVSTAVNVALWSGSIYYTYKAATLIKQYYEFAVRSVQLGARAGSTAGGAGSGVHLLGVIIDQLGLLFEP